jgi:periplasmic divalent cation tolerance protein
MLTPSSTTRIVITTAGSADEAQKLARTLVEERLIACATLLPGAQSIYRWQGVVETAGETAMLLKTSEECLQRLEARLRELHSYEVPEFLVLAVESGSRGYLDWLQGNLGLP